MARELLDHTLFAQIAAQIDMIANDQALVEVLNFGPREHACRVLTEQIIGRLERLIDGVDKGPKKKLRALKRQADAARFRLRQAHEQLFALAREQLRRDSSSPSACMQLLARYEQPHHPEIWSDPPHYDGLDTFVDGVLQIDELPRLQLQPGPEMVLYQPTPARIVLNLSRRLQLSHDDVVYDLGAGLGRVAIIMGLVSSAQIKGVEYEPAYVEYARLRAESLNLARTTFINGDARDVDYADGTVFYLYTPFKGSVLQTVLERLRAESQRRRIRVCTYGPGTLEVLPQEWLVSSDSWEPDIHRPTIYESR